jgi:hypothetical protein
MAIAANVPTHHSRRPKKAIGSSETLADFSGKCYQQGTRTNKQREFLILWLLV